MTDTFRHDAGHSFGAILKPLGFKKQGLTWQRASGAFIDLVDLQVSQFDRAFTINLGVGIPTISEEIFISKKAAKYAVDGLVEARLGGLVYDGKDYWWSKDKPLEVQDAVEKLQIHGPAYFEKYHDASVMIQTLEAGKHGIRLTFPKSFYLALLHIQFGDKQKGCELLRAIALRPPAPWNEPALALLNRFSCNSL